MTSGQRRFAVAVAAVLAVQVSMVALDMGPDVLLVSAVVVCALAFFWSWLGLTETTGITEAPPKAIAEAPRSGADRSVRSLRTGLLFGASVGGHTERLHASLVELIDDQLLHAHGVDRRTDPQEAADIMGSELNGFVIDPDAHGTSSVKRLARIVTLIERI